jgi:hypothetical protein
MFGCMFRSFLNVAIQYSRKFKSSFLLYKYLILNFFVDILVCVLLVVAFLEIRFLCMLE